MKLFENYWDDVYISDRETYVYDTMAKYTTSIRRILRYLKVDYEWNEEPTGLHSEYDVDVIDFFKEIFIGKKIIFESLDRTYSDDPIISGKVEDVGVYEYQDEFFIRVKIDDEWHLIKPAKTIVIKKYDAENKPLHQEVIVKKQAKKYNI
jgi:hypothetical protein